MITKRFNAVFFFLIFGGFSGFSQSFEGKIVYQLSFKSKMPNVSDEQFQQMMGTQQEYMMKGGNYKSKSNGSMFQWQLYRSAENKLYSKMASSPVVFWNDGAVNPDEIMSVETNIGVVNILGHSCDKLILNCKSGLQKYYFSPKLKVDPSLFKDHKFGNWNEYISRSNALPLKFIIETPQFVMESEATEIAPGKLESKEFELPPDSQLQKSPY